MKIGPSTHPVRIRGGTSGALTFNLVSGVTLTLTGEVTASGPTTSFTLSDSNNGDTCSGTLASVLTASCTINGWPMTITGVLVTASGLVGVTTYCGLESAASSGYGAGALLIGIAGTNAFVGRIATVNDSASLYVGSVASGSSMFATNIGFGAENTNTVSGSFSATSASGTESNSSGVIGNWTAISPCPLMTATAAPSSVTFSANANQTPPNQTITVTPSGGPGTLGPMAAVISPASATWLTATVSGSNAVTLSVSPQSTGASVTATVEIYAMFATTPLSVRVTYTVAGPTSSLVLGTTNRGDLYEFSNPSPAFGAPNKVASTVAGLSSLAVDQQGNLWMSSPSTGTLYEKTAAHLGSGSYDASFTIAGPAPLPQSNIQPSGIAFDVHQTLWVLDSANSGWLYAYSSSALGATPIKPDPTYYLQLTGVTGAQLTAVAFDPAGNMWIADAGNSVVYELLNAQISGSVQSGPVQAVGYIPLTAKPSSIAFDPNGNMWVAFSSTQPLSVFTPSQIANIQGRSVVTPNDTVYVYVASATNPASSIAFDGAGNLWLVQSGSGTGTVGVVQKVELPTNAGQFGVPASAYGPPAGDTATSIAFDPPPAGVPMYSVLGGGRHAPSQAPLAAVRGAPVRRQ